MFASAATSLTLTCHVRWWQTNFALPHWVPYAAEASRCLCRYGRGLPYIEPEPFQRLLRAGKPPPKGHFPCCHCGKAVKGKGSLATHEKFCIQRKVLEDFKLSADRADRGDLDGWPCKHCGKVINGRGSRATHEVYCKKRGNAASTAAAMRIAAVAEAARLVVEAVDAERKATAGAGTSHRRKRMQEDIRPRDSMRLQAGIAGEVRLERHLDGVSDEEAALTANAAAAAAEGGADTAEEATRVEHEPVRTKIPEGLGRGGREKEVQGKGAGANDGGAQDEVATRMLSTEMASAERSGEEEEGFIDEMGERKHSDQRRKQEDSRGGYFVHPNQLNLKPPRSGAPCEQIQNRTRPFSPHASCLESNCNVSLILLFCARLKKTVPRVSAVADLERSKRRKLPAEPLGSSPCDSRLADDSGEEDFDLTVVRSWPSPTMRDLQLEEEGEDTEDGQGELRDLHEEGSDQCEPCEEDDRADTLRAMQKGRVTEARWDGDEERKRRSPSDVTLPRKSAQSSSANRVGSRPGRAQASSSSTFGAGPSRSTVPPGQGKRGPGRPRKRAKKDAPIQELGFEPLNLEEAKAFFRHSTLPPKERRPPY